MKENKCKHDWRKYSEMCEFYCGKCLLIVSADGGEFTVDKRVSEFIGRSNIRPKNKKANIKSTVFTYDYNPSYCSNCGKVENHNRQCTNINCEQNPNKAKGFWNELGDSIAPPY